MMELIQVFYEPGKVFDRVREQRIWVVALLAIVIATAAMYAYSVQQIGGSNIQRHAVENSKMMSNIPQDKKDEMIANADTTKSKVIGDVATGVVVGIIMLVLAALFMAIAGVSGQPIKFTQAIGTVCYSAWPFTILTIVLSIAVISMAQDKSELDPRSLLFFNLGAALDKATTNKSLFALAQSIDLLRFAQIAFSAWALAKVAKIPFSRALTGQILIWVVFTLLGMVGAMFF
jgi:hypothetical protein